MTFFGLTIMKDSTSFDEPVWVCFYGIHMHINHSLFGLIKEIITEYENDKHLAM